MGSLCVDYGPNPKKNFHCHSKHLSPFGFIFLKFSGEPNIKTPQTLESLRFLLRVLSCPFFFLCLCRYEKDMVLPLVIFALWERIWNNSWNANRLPMTRALWKPVPMYWFAPERDPVGLGAASPVQTARAADSPPEAGTFRNLSCQWGTQHPTSSQARYKCVLAFESLLVYCEHTLSHFQLTSLERRMRSLFNTQAVISKDIRILWFFLTFNFILEYSW